MVITNATRGTTLANRGWRAAKALARMKGLLGRSGLEAGEGIHIEPCNSIHTFFMRFAIDVLFLDREGKVLRAFEALPPWRVTRVYARARSVVELPPGTLAATGTYEGDQVVFGQLTDVQGADAS
jgi:uncharacterized membrane protein (UPF0127 family)